MTGFFDLISLILKLLGFWDRFMDYMNNKISADQLAKQQARDKAVDDSTTAETDDQIWKDQDEITRNSPR